MEKIAFSFSLYLNFTCTDLTQPVVVTFTVQIIPRPRLIMTNS